MNRGISYILGATALSAALVAGLVAFGSDAIAAEGKGPAPLSKDDASARPWKRDPRWPKRDESKFSTLANPHVSPPAPTEPRKLAEPITGDPAKGAKLVADRSRGGSCLACHVMGPAGGADLPGNVGPDLSEIGNAGRDDEWLFNYVYDARVYNPGTVMPPWGTHGLFNDQEIGDIVAFLKTLKSPAVFKSELDDPNKRPRPVEKRDNLDPLENPAMWTIEHAQALYTKRTASGFSCASCHGKAEERFKTWAASMPKWEPRLDKVLGIEEFVARHAKATLGVDWLMQSDDNIAMSVYLRNLANGQEMHVDITSPGAKEAYERGKALSAIKIGQLNFSCVDCHDASKAGLKWIRGQWLGEQKGQLDHFPTWRTSQQVIWDIRKRFQWCNVAIWANELPPDAREYGDLELYLASANSGLKLNVPGIRH
ncbi:MAG TPA: sulfur oxidation c-type cytochrome SoxA [Xanthobacteraceae bacterium]|nr:sulfur oxidation c-type cytochrome SoxA [Xanthobacteraceae bacterium]